MGTPSRPLGMIVRADNGGLGNQTWEIWRHLQPERTLVLLSGNERGADDYTRYREGVSDVVYHEGLQLSTDVLREFAQSCAAIFTVETPYHVDGARVIRKAKCSLYVLANPELWNEAEYGTPSKLFVPTMWERSRLPQAELLPQPVALDRFDKRERSDGLFTFYHPGAPAMLDRNGTGVLLDALPLITTPCRVIIRHPANKRPHTEIIGDVEVVYLPPDDGPYWNAYPPDTDMMVLPRKYGGLSLSLLEAAALGVPALMPAIAPQVAYEHVAYIPMTGEHDVVPMKGGMFNVYEIEPEPLAQRMSKLAASPSLVAAYSARAYAWAQAHSWDVLLPRWREALDLDR